MQAMILAAGLGSRLKPLTSFLPKPLFPVLNTPIIDRTLFSLVSSGFSHIIINSYHLSFLLEEWLSQHPLRERVSLVKESELLGTGGGVKNASSLFKIGEPVLIVNADIVTNIDYAELMYLHSLCKSSVSLVVHRRDPFNNVRLSKDLVKGFQYEGNDAVAYTGISVVDPLEVINFEIEKGSLLQVFNNAIGRYGGCNAIHISSVCREQYCLWEDIGSPSGYLSGNRILLESDESRIAVGKSTELPSDLKISDWSSIGSKVTIGSNVRICRSVIWDGVVLEDNQTVIDSICTPDMILSV